MAKKNAFNPLLKQPHEVFFDKWKTQLQTADFADISVSWIGHMVASPTQFFTNFFERKDYCIQYVIRGKGHYFTNNRLHSLKTGTLWLLPKKQYHYYMAKREDPYEYYWIHLDGTGAERFLKKIGLTESNPVIHNLNSPEIMHTFINLIEIAKKENVNAHYILSSLHSLLYAIEEAVEISKNKKIPVQKDTAIDDTIMYIKENYQKNISLDDLAQIARLDKMYLVKKFKKHTKLTPIQFLIQYRISQSCNLLHSPMSITEIALSCGFNTVGNYLRRFKDFLGITPTQYRENITPPKKQKTKRHEGD